MSEYELLESALGESQWLAVAMAVVTVFIRVYRNPSVQGLLPKGAQWNSLPRWATWATVFVASLLVSWSTAMVAGQPASSAFFASVPVALGAVATHKITKTAGHAHTRAKLRKDPEYRPGSIRTALDVVVPVDRKRLAET